MRALALLLLLSPVFSGCDLRAYRLRTTGDPMAPTFELGRTSGCLARNGHLRVWLIERDGRRYQDGPVVWAIAHVTDDPVELRAITYGRPPPGFEVLSPPVALEPGSAYRVVYACLKSTWSGSFRIAGDGTQLVVTSETRASD